MAKLKWLINEGNYYYFGDAPVHATGVSLNKDMISFTSVGQTEHLIATVYPSDAVDKKVIWSSSDANIATVTNSGLVTCVSIGEATITATTEDGLHTANCSVVEMGSGDLSDYTLYSLYESSSYVKWDGIVASFDGNSILISDGRSAGSSSGGGPHISVYSLSNKYDVSDITYIGGQTYSNTQSPKSAYIKPDGTRVFVWDYSSSTGQAIKEFEITGGDLTTINTTPIRILSIPIEGTGCWYFKSDGTKFYYSVSTGGGAYALNEYELSTPWDITTATPTGISGGILNVSCIWFNFDGTKLYTTPPSGDVISQYDLPSPYNISELTSSTTPTATLETGIGYAYGLSLSRDNKYLLVCGATASAYPRIKIFKYS